DGCGVTNGLGRFPTDGEQAASAAAAISPVPSVRLRAMEILMVNSSPAVLRATNVRRPVSIRPAILMESSRAANKPPKSPIPLTLMRHNVAIVEQWGLRPPYRAAALRPA